MKVVTLLLLSYLMMITIIDYTLAREHILVTSEFLDFNAAELFCKTTLGTNLATVKTAAEQTVLEALLNELPALDPENKNNTGAWIGLNDIKADRLKEKFGWTFTSNENEPTVAGDFEAWSLAGPEPTGGGGENCVRLDKIKNGKWADSGCNVKRNFFCDVAAVGAQPPPPPAADPNAPPVVAPNAGAIGDEEVIQIAAAGSSAFVVGVGLAYFIKKRKSLPTFNTSSRKNRNSGDYSDENILSTDYAEARSKGRSRQKSPPTPLDSAPLIRDRETADFGSFNGLNTTIDPRDRVERTTRAPRQEYAPMDSNAAGTPMSYYMGGAFSKKTANPMNYYKQDKRNRTERGNDRSRGGRGGGGRTDQMTVQYNEDKQKIHRILETIPDE